MKQLFKKEELIGKTIKNIIINYDVWISFTDDSFIQIEQKDCGEGFESVIKMNIHDYTIDYTNCELIELGLITYEQYELAIEEQLKKQRKYIEERQIKEKQEIEEREKKLLVELKKKYDN